MTTAHSTQVQTTDIKDWAKPISLIIEPRGRAALKIRKGQKVRITDLEGQQVMDFVSTRVADPDERQSAMFTNVVLNKWDLHEGYIIYSTKCNPLLKVLHEDGGHHAMSGYCSKYSNEKRYGIPNTPSCYANLSAGWRDFGLDETKLSPDMCISVFMNIQFLPSGEHRIVEPTTKAGDYIEFEALDDLYMAFSNCPEEHNACNAHHLTPMALSVSE